MNARSLALAAAFAFACSHVESSSETATRPSGGGGDPLAAFETVKTVLQSPRCVNCHPTGDSPLQGDDGHVHPQFVTRGPEGKGAPGLACATCHALANPPASYGAHMPPGVSTGWRLPPPEHKLVFAGMASGPLCEQLKDAKRNGGKDMAALFKHVSSDPLVLWGWSPGYGRPPVPIAHDDFVKAFKTWMDAGAPCGPVKTASLR
jgi:hypothetical protein